MADSMNHVRAMRLAEIVQEFRNLQHYINQIRLEPAQGDGYELLQQCFNEGQAVLKAPFDASAPPPAGDVEKEKAQLKQVILDASARRFQAQRIYLRATAAMRWISSRNAMFKEGNSSASQSTSIEELDDTLQAELAAITDEKVIQDLQVNDQQQGKWVDEDPDLSAIQQWLAAGQE